MVPTVNFCGATVSRLIVGGNPFAGHTYIHRIASSDDMLDYYTADRILQTLFAAEDAGYQTFLPIADDFMLRVIRQYKKEGGKMNWIAQPHPPMQLEVNIRLIAALEPVAVFHQGTMTDNLLEAGRDSQLLENIQLIKSAGLSAGLCTHVPETVIRAEAEGWGCDFYMCCLHNLRKNVKYESSFITGVRHEFQFDPEDRPKMLQVIRKTNKPCIAFKILAGGNTANGREQIRDAFRETFEGIKPSDAAVVGVFQRDKNQLSENAEILREVLG